jgi:transposase
MNRGQAMTSKANIFTIGHSTHPLDRFLGLLARHGIEALADIRRFPGSRKHPHFNRDNLAAALQESGVEYRWLEALGGRRPKGYSSQEVADFLGVDASGVRRWVAACQRQGASALQARAVPGRPRKLSATQQRIVLRWLGENPTDHGFATELWTAGRLAQLVGQEWGVAFNPGYLCQWLRQQGCTLRKPCRVPRERDDEAIVTWLARDWPRIKKRRGGGART